MNNFRPYLPTFSGKQFWLDEIDRELICIEDIAHHLSNLCRYTGGCREFYSVAQHSVLCAVYAPAVLKFEALMHDAAEAYTNDLAHHFKRLPELSGFRIMEGRVDAEVRLKFQMLSEEPSLVEEIDRRVAITEKRDLFGPEQTVNWYREAELTPYEGKIVPWSPKQSETAFLTMYSVLEGLRWTRDKR